MGERTSYTQGTFSWADLATTDEAGAKDFYAAVFGWEHEDMPVGDDAVYSMQRIGGRNVAAIAGQPQQQREAGVPPAWQSYITVDSVDAMAAKAGELGGTVHAEPFDVMDAGRMAVVQDPQGAFFMLWEARQNIGAHLVNEPGALTWNELATTDLDGARSFYSGLFGWETSQFDQTPQTYYGIQNAGQSNGGMREATPPGTPPHWLVYFGTDDVDASLAKVEQNGGSVVVGKTDIGVGRIAVAQDPQGAFFAVYEGQLDP